MSTLKSYLQAKEKMSRNEKEVQFTIEILNLIENQTKEFKKDPSIGGDISPMLDLLGKCFRA
ncbi:hypothetical protein [Chengkuizengella sediminis]|uniref:hypothetical protein n=1 Tax=Chengkuizengella sediminis TaxID=1885917 RepID=UPI001389E1A9|nr:hypothetical protein [Chengkuizengella sediminis]NDI34586.1 hypothetical protein [Chengkuizengella sediminis]